MKILTYSVPNGVVQKLSKKGCGSVDRSLQIDFQTLFLYRHDMGRPVFEQFTIHSYLEVPTHSAYALSEFSPAPLVLKSC